MAPEPWLGDVHRIDECRKASHQVAVVDGEVDEGEKTGSSGSFSPSATVVVA